MKTIHTNRIARHRRVRAKISGTAERPRLSVFRSNRALYAQIIDDTVGKTLLAVRMGKPSSKKKGSTAKKETLQDIARKAGVEIAAKAQKNNIRRVVFDRGGYVYHGRIKALAEG